MRIGRPPGSVGDKTLAWLNAVADWSDHRHVEIKIWRTNMPIPGCFGLICDWRLTLMFRDAQGAFQFTVHADQPKRGEGGDAFTDRINHALDKACAEARRRRIMAQTHADPQRVLYRATPNAEATT